nr:uncharacterized protein LOC100185865 isoform X2 [Ciona intestinalis]|eukprot:XP_026690412.1 uncharacterized protein LOC100185865 isoform X2 [Ciona intestinalis]
MNMHSCPTVISILCLVLAMPHVNGNVISLNLLTAHEGSGTTVDPIQECITTFEGYDKYYLQGAKEDSYIAYNTTTFDQCMMKCCTEERFECKSFSFLVELDMCFVLNITQYDERATLKFSVHYVHYQRKIGTDEPTTFGATETTNVVTTSSFHGPRTMRNSYIPSTETVRTICPRTCKNGGECRLFEVAENEENNELEPVVARCQCQPGFSGLFCEQAAQAAGVPVYVIVVAVLGSIILILFAAVLVTYVLYRKRTGKYRVREQRQRWDKKSDARRAQSFNSLARRSPGGSELSVPGSVNSTATRSTTTSS